MYVAQYMSLIISNQSSNQGNETDILENGSSQKTATLLSNHFCRIIVLHGTQYARDLDVASVSGKRLAIRKWWLVEQSSRLHELLFYTRKLYNIFMI